VGRNGSGKTTLFRLITGEEEPDSGIISIPRNYSMGYLSQTLSFSQGTVLGEASLGLKTNEDGRDESYKVKSILLGLGIDETEFRRSPTELSSGFQIRLNLAKVLVAQPDLLLLDEPTNYLDIVSARWLQAFLKAWKHELVLITHDRGFMDSVVTHVMAIHRQGIRKVAGSTQKLYEQILQDEEVYEKTRINDERKRKELEQFINRFRAQATRARAVQSRIKALEKRKSLGKLIEMRDLDFEFPGLPFSGKWLMDVKNLGFSYEAGAPLISGLTFSIGKRDRIGVIGKNGKGKTTLLGLLAGELSPLEGAVGRSSGLEVGYFGQTNIDRLDGANTVEEEIMHAHPDRERSASPAPSGRGQGARVDCGLFLSGKPRPVGGELHSSRGSARNICGAMLFDGDKALKKISVLSGGEKSRVLLGKMLLRRTNLLLLDEPTNHLDMESVDSLVEAIDAFEGAVVLATHSEMILHAVAERLIVFDGGNPWLFEGSYQDFLDRAGWRDEEATVRQPEETEDRRWQKTEKKELKRIRAEVIAERSRALSPLEQDIARIEKRIVELEERVRDENMALIRASQAGVGRTISSLSVSIHNAKKEIEELFEQLEAISGEHSVRVREFEARLEELEQKKRPAQPVRRTSSAKYS